MSLFIFRTSVKTWNEVIKMSNFLGSHPDIKRWTIDYDDWEKVLRVECDVLTAGEITSELATMSIFATEMA